MSERCGETHFHSVWYTSCNCKGSPRKQFSELTLTVKQYADRVSTFNTELVTLGSQLATEHAKLRERLLKRQDAPGIARFELGYLDTMRQHYTDELTRLFGIGDEMLKRSVTAWGNGMGPHETSVSSHPVCRKPV